MKNKAFVFWILLALAFCAAVSCNHGSSDDAEPETDDDTAPDQYDLPDDLDACPAYEEKMPWFAIEDHVVDDNDLSKEAMTNFIEANVSFESDNVCFDLDGVQLVLDWRTENPAPPFTEGQTVQILISSSGDFNREYPATIWVNDESGKLLLYKTNIVSGGLRELGSHSAKMTKDYFCEYYDNQPPPAFVDSWRRVLGLTVSGYVDDAVFTAVEPGANIISDNGLYSIYVPFHYIGTHDPSNVVFTQSVGRSGEFLIQIVRK